MHLTVQTIQTLFISASSITGYLKLQWAQARRRARFMQRQHPAMMACLLILTLTVGSLLTPAAMALAEELTADAPSIPLPETFYLRPLPDDVAVRRHYPIASEAGRARRLRVVPHRTGEDTSIFLDRDELFRFRPTATTPDAYPVALQTARKLHELLIAGHDIDTLHVVTADSNAVIQLGEVALVTLDDEQAKAASMADANQLASIWTGHVRRAFGLTEDATVHTDADAYVVSGMQQSGQASWYGPGFQGRRTANGERFNMHAQTAAHRTLPFGTLVQVTNRNNGKQVVVKINDRGPYAHGRIIDLSKGAAKVIGLDRSGVAPVTIAVVSQKPAEAVTTPIAAKSGETSPARLAIIERNAKRIPVLRARPTAIPKIVDTPAKTTTTASETPVPVS